MKRERLLLGVYELILTGLGFWILGKSALFWMESMLGWGANEWLAYILLALMTLGAEFLLIPFVEGGFLTGGWAFALVSLMGLGFPATVWMLWVIVFLTDVLARPKDLLRSVGNASAGAVNLYVVNLARIWMGGESAVGNLLIPLTLGCAVVYYLMEVITVTLAVGIRDGRLFKRRFWWTRWKESAVKYTPLALGAVIMARVYFSPYWMVLFPIIGGVILGALYILRAAERNREALRGVLEAFSGIVEGRWTGMQGHGKRVGELVEAMANELDLPYEEKELLVFAGVIHDIGVVEVPYRLLNYPSPKGEESGEFQYHTIKGAEIAGGVEYLRPIMDIIRYHHERIDGEGYPEGLKGEEIPFYAQLIGICCDFDDLRCYKSWRERMGYEQALKIIEERVGSWYSEEVYRLFLKALKRVSPPG